MHDVPLGADAEYLASLQSEDSVHLAHSECCDQCRGHYGGEDIKPPDNGPQGAKDLCINYDGVDEPC